MGNLYPYPCPNLQEWGHAAQQETGFATRQRYVDWCRSHRLPAVETWANEYRPDVVICIGTSHRVDFSRVFFEQRPAELIRHEYGPQKKALFHRSLEGRLVVVIEHLSGCIHSHEELQYAGDYIAQLRRDSAGHASSSAARDG